MKKMKHLILTAVMSAVLIMVAVVSASALSDIVVDSVSDASFVKIEGTALPKQWVSVKVTYQDEEIAYFNGQVAGTDGAYSFDADLSDYSGRMPLDLTVTYGSTVETAQIKIRNDSGGNAGGGGGGTIPSGDSNIELNNGNGGTVSVSPQDAKKGDEVTITVRPDSGYLVEQVKVTDKDGKEIDVQDRGSGIYTFVMPSSRVTVNVAYKTEEKPGASGFEDVPDGAWYREAVYYVVEQGCFKGVSDTLFNPDATMTRAMFATAVGRMAGVNENSYTGSSFSDVSEGQWYSAYVKWASDNGIVNGVGNGKFEPDMEITREQMAVMLCRYAEYAGIDITPASGAPAMFAAYPDSVSVSDYAKDAMIWAVGAGIINGSDGKLKPQADATRAQVAQIIMNYAQKTGQTA